MKIQIYLRVILAMAYCILTSSASTDNHESINCPTGTWVKEIRVKPGHVYGIEFDCFAPGDISKTATKLAAKGITMGRNLLSHCSPKAMRGVSFTWNDGELLARGYCEYNQHHHYPYGSLCGNPTTAVCGLTINKNDEGNKATSAGITCCHVPNPATTCRPSDRFEMIKQCDNTGGATQLECSYQKTVGISTSRSNSGGSNRQSDFYSSFYKGFGSSKSTQSSSQSESETNWNANAGISLGLINIGGGGGGSNSHGTSSGISSELHKNFGSNLGQSSSTGYNWHSSSEIAWNEQTVSAVAFSVASGIRTKLEQAVGICGFMQVRTNYIRRTDFDKNGNKFTSGLSFEIEPEPTTEEPDNEYSFSIDDVSEEEVPDGARVFFKWLLQYIKKKNAKNEQ